MQNSRSDVNAPPSVEADAARYFDYESAVALRTLAAAHGTAMPRYLLAPEVAVLLAAVTDLKRRLFIDTLWNTGGRLNEVLPLTPDDFVLDDPLTGAPLSSPFVVLRTLKQRRDEYRRRQRGRGRPTREEQDADRAAQLNPPRAVPLTDPAYVRRVQEYLATARPRRTDRIWDVRSEDTVRT